MAHIARCMADGSGAETGGTPNTSKSSSPLLSSESATTPAWSSWRMQQPQPERKYQLFPKSGLPPILPSVKGMVPDKAPAHATGQSAAPPPGSVTMAGQSVQQPGPDGRPPTGSVSLRTKIKEHGLGRRRKVSVPELGPMTTVQEAAMDSPTIPGRPPLHERSISAPGGGSKHHDLDGTTFFLSGNFTVDEIPEIDVPSPVAAAFSPIADRPDTGSSGSSSTTTTSSSSNHGNYGNSNHGNHNDNYGSNHGSNHGNHGHHGKNHSNHGHANYNPNDPRITAPSTLSPRQQLAPLVIPTQPPAPPPPPPSAKLHRKNSVSRQPSLSRKPSLSRQMSVTRTRSETTPAAAAETHIARRGGDSPRLKAPYTPLSASSSFPTPRSAVSAATGSTLPTPISASIPEGHVSPQHWEVTGRSPPTGNGPGSTTAAAAASTTAASSAHECGNATPKSELSTPSSTCSKMVHHMSHRRGQSESGSSIMERGRPRSRLDRRIGVPAKKAEERRTTSAERKAFEELPQGVKPSDALSTLSQTEMDCLQQQALGQASRFEVLRAHEVEALARELRQLDERTEYLRRTYTSLRAGRRNLHSRICQYLRSPLVATFRSESMLKQEEALAELDASIDDWVTKLEQAENRRTRVRQKLLEHVAAAVILPVSAASAYAIYVSPSHSPSSHSPSSHSPTTSTAAAAPPSAAVASESLQLAMGIQPAPLMGVGNISTPPRSPTKPAFAAHSRSASAGNTSPSPHRLAAHVPSTIFEHPVFEDDDENAVEALEQQEEDDYNYKDYSHRPRALSRREVQSIRIYADHDVYELLADVENQIAGMGRASSDAAEDSQDGQRDVHRAHSHEMLVGPDTQNQSQPRQQQHQHHHHHHRHHHHHIHNHLLSPSTPATLAIPNLHNKTMPRSPPPPLPPSKDGPAAEPEPAILLTKAVFKPERAIAV